MTGRDLLNALNDENESLPSRKRLLLVHLRDQLERQRSNPEDSQTIAYGIAGLMATRTAQSLGKDDPCSQALVIAGQLELPEEHRSADASWKELEKKVKQAL